MILAFTAVLIALLLWWIERLLLRRVSDVRNQARVRTFTIIVGVVAFGFVLTTIFQEMLGQLTLAFGVVGAVSRLPPKR